MSCGGSCGGDCGGDGGEIIQLEQKPMGNTGKTLSMTKEAADFVAMLLKKDGKGKWGLKVEVVPGGCAGYKYFMGFQEKPEVDEQIFSFHGTKIFLDKESLEMIRGSTIEYVNSLEATGLKVNNPNMTRTCGCGKSFG